MNIWYTKNGYKVIQVLSGRSNALLINYREKYVLVDTSIGMSWKLLQKRLHALHINRIDYLIMTHSHFDHAANAYRIKEKYKTRVIIHKAAAALLAKGKNENVSGTFPIIRAIVNFFAPTFFQFFNFDPCQPDIQIEDFYRLNESGLNIQIIHTPGHTDGSISIIVDDEIALVGDAMFGVFKDSVFPPFASNTEQMIRSWGKLLETSCKLYIPSHGSADSRSLVEKDYAKRTQKLLS